MHRGFRGGVFLEGEGGATLLGKYLKESDLL